MLSGVAGVSRIAEWVTMDNATIEVRVPANTTCAMSVSIYLGIN